MPRNAFDEQLPLLPAGVTSSGSQLSVCAMGPVAPGDTVHSMRVWVYQQVGTQVAASSGNGGEHLGGHPMSDRESLPFTDELGWMIQTELEGESAQFTKGKPALATAMAIVEHKDGSKDVEHWSQGILIRQ
jgi:hypothetical protein